MTDDWYMKKACEAASQSTCLKRKVGAIIVKNDSILAEGCNGGEKEFYHCTNSDKKICYWKEKAYELADKRNVSFSDEQFQTIKKEARLLCLSICAERNAIYKVLNIEDMHEAVMYCTTYPCPMCAKLIRLVGISQLYYMHDFDINRSICFESKRIFDEAGIKQEALTIEGECSNVGKRTDYEYRR